METATNLSFEPRQRQGDNVFVQALVSAVVRQWQRLRDYRERRALLRTLESLQPWQLKDIGVSRADLEAIADGSFSKDPSRRARA